MPTMLTGLGAITRMYSSAIGTVQMSLALLDVVPRLGAARLDAR
jgi:hypothetical protein